MSTVVDDFATKRAALDEAGFLDAIGADAVLVRLDERGGRDEPAPWAFHGVPRTASLGPRDDEKIDAEKIRSIVDEETDSGVFTTASPADATMTGEKPITLPLPAARGAASVVLVRFDGARAEIGRSPERRVHVEERSISKLHAELSGSAKSGFTVTDRDSQNGTAVNGRRLDAGARARIESGDTLELGDVVFLFLAPRDFYAHLPKLLG